MGVLTTQTRAAEFRETLSARESDRRVLVADGAMGTMLISRGAFANRCLDELNLSLPALVRDVHRDYARAGAEILTTNTFGANRKRLGTFGFAEKVRPINQAGVRIARDASRDQAFIAGVVGPLGVLLEPLGATTREEAGILFREQVAALVEAGVDLLMLETFQDLNELREAVLAARDVAGHEIVIAAHVSVEDDGTLADGASTGEFTRSLDEWPVDIIGVNCCSGPSAVLETIEKMAAYTTKPLSALPNAGVVGEAFSPAYLARYARRFQRSGVRMTGGCCGTTPEHIKAIREELQSFEAEAPHPAVSRSRQEAGFEPLKKVPLAEKSRLGAKLAAGHFVTLLEIRPPRGTEVAEQYNASGIDALVVGDGARGRLSAAATCHLIQQQTGIEAVLRLSGRGRNVLSLQSELLGAHALGIRNILCGEDAAAAITIANRLNEGCDLGGHPIGSRTGLVVGVEGQINAGRIGPGAEYLVTPPVFDLEAFETFLRDVSVPVVARVHPLAGVRDAEAMINEMRVPVPASYVARLSTAQDAEAEGIAIARELVERLRHMVAGVQLSGGAATLSKWQRT
jgi:methionine synthase I (cobalamin-dependent)/5,10-methylenetetrahydrofolate reductase